MIIGENSHADSFDYDQDCFREWDHTASSSIAALLYALREMLVYPTQSSISEYGWVMDASVHNVWGNLHNRDMSIAQVSHIVESCKTVYNGIVERLDDAYRDSIVFLVSDANGIYSGKCLAETIAQAHTGVFSSYDQADIDILLQGPETEGYWDSLDSLFCSLVMTVDNVDHSIWSVDGGIAAFPQNSPEGFWDRNNF